MDRADMIATAIVDTPGVLQVWPKAGYCRRCNQPLAGSALDLIELKNRIAEAIRAETAVTKEEHPNHG